MKTQKTLYKTIDPLIGLGIGVLYYLTYGEHIPNFIYSFIAIIFALYFFPVKLFLFNQKETEQKWSFIHALSDPVISLLFALSILSLFTPEGDNMFRNIIAIAAIINGLLMWYHYFAGSSKYFVATHFCLGFLSAGMVLG